MLLKEMDGYSIHSMPNYDFLSGNGYSMKQFFHSNSDGDSSSTKSEQSRQDLSAVSDSNLNVQHTPTQSDRVYNNDSSEKRDQGMVKSVFSLGNPETDFPPPKLDYSQPFTCVSYQYAADPYYGGVLTGYTSNALVHRQINGAANSRVPLPVEPASEEPIFVNAKQYNAILRRRQMRAKLEAQNKLVKSRKDLVAQLIHLMNSNSQTFQHHLICPLATCMSENFPERLISMIPFSSQPYLHESRHRHAMKRARGSGGRFLNKKELQELQQKASTSLQTPAGGISKMALGRDLCPENSTSHSPPSPGISSVSNGAGMLAYQEHISMNFSAQNGGGKMGINGVRRHTPIVR
ncbi:hypothetical protein ACP70R_014346 [Stipagrostis hirtigluma subsp. patula]